ncbi:hypothetical protein CSB93_6401 [Pseudomonas paraeruginosa]|uniref:Uncharacterized protein n=1 Tax=Pseudomonas paraeruginosa TaxID=2994495 RepID=A0A2R3IP01_9PSED|nr:hypothetical protein CSB93_6401 [Pseudomonas paraeruginosa]AWE90503.1 hypothetical protein CSC28_5204 [Pseudomonas paraeruginosa]PTC34902.1 hypothetical protein CLJ1_4767 [Pseudomonas aeruginosa]
MKGGIITGKRARLTPTVQRTRSAARERWRGGCNALLRRGHPPSAL